MLWWVMEGRCERAEKSCGGLEGDDSQKEECGYGLPHGRHQTKFEHTIEAHAGKNQQNLPKPFAGVARYYGFHPHQRNVPTIH